MVFCYNPSHAAQIYLSSSCRFCARVVVLIDCPIESNILHFQSGMGLAMRLTMA